MSKNRFVLARVLAENLKTGLQEAEDLIKNTDKIRARNVRVTNILVVSCHKWKASMTNKSALFFALIGMDAIGTGVKQMNEITDGVMRKLHQVRGEEKQKFLYEECEGIWENVQPQRNFVLLCRMHSINF